MQRPNAGSHKGKICIKVLPLYKLHLVAASRSYTRAQDGLDTVQLALVVFFLPSTSANTPLALMVVITCCNLHCVVFFLGALAHLLMCTQTNMHKLQLALCGGGGGCGCIFMWCGDDCMLHFVVVVCCGIDCTWI